MADEVTAAEELLPHVVSVEIDGNAEDIDATKLYASPERVIYFRDLSSWDIPQVRQLHEEWFPIRYNQAFYDGAAQGLWVDTGGPLFARLAVEMKPSMQLVQLRLEDRRAENILGAVTASTLPLSKVDDPNLIASDDWEHTEIMYILTLGTRLSVRRMGIASALLQECIAQACRQPQCGAVYLHVKADNLSARHFYEKNGFENLRILQDYYMINGVRHDAFLYICYVNGAAPRSDWFDLITRPLLALFSFASFGWKKLIEGFTTEKFQDTTAKKLTSTPLSAPAESANLVLVFREWMPFAVEVCHHHFSIKEASTVCISLALPRRLNDYGFTVGQILETTHDSSSYCSSCACCLVCPEDGMPVLTTHCSAKLGPAVRMKSEIAPVSSIFSMLVKLDTRQLWILDVELKLNVSLRIAASE